MHAVVDGDVDLWVEDPGDALRLLPGDVVLVRESTRHHVAYLPGAPCVELAQAITPGSGLSRRFAVGDPRLPPAAAFFCGQRRRAAGHRGRPRTGGRRASADPRISTTRRALQARPEHQWTVAELAEHAPLSRSAFARHFTELVGVPPLTYLASGGWR